MDRPSQSIIGWVYFIVCAANGKVYVGSTTNPKRRFYGHMRDLNSGNHHSPVLQAAWNKYGKDQFRFEIVEEVRGLAELLAAEQRLIDAKKGCSMNCSPTAGSPLGVLRTEDQRKKASEAKRRFYASDAGKAAIEQARLKKIGRVQSPEERAMRSKVLKGKKKCGGVWTVERRISHSKAITGRKMPPVSEETRRAISAAKKGSKLPKSAYEAASAKIREWIDAEVSDWVMMVKDGKSYREIERITGRSRDVVARECRKVIDGR